MSKFASNTDNISTPTQDELEKGFAGCGGDGLPMTSANINGVLNVYSSAVMKNSSDIVSMQDAINAINTDQAKLAIEDGKLVLINEDGTRSEVEIDTTPCLSSDSGNLLELREDPKTGELCMYYGVEAELNLTRLYVDSESGNDDQTVDGGGGTITNPFRTLDKALDQIPEDKSSSVYLKSVGSNNRPLTYDVNKDRYMRGGAIRIIRPYGAQPFISDEIAQCVQSKTYHWNPEAANEYVRPIVRFNWHKVPIKPDVKQYIRTHSGDENSGFIYIAVDVLLTKAPFSTTEFPIRYSNISRGGVFELYKGNMIWEDNSTAFIMLVSNNSSVVLGKVNLLNLPDDIFLYYLYKGSLQITSSAFDGVSFPHILEECDPDGSITTMGHNATEVMQTGVRFIGVARHPSGVPLNVTANFSF